MTFWDSSALVPLFASETRTPDMQSRYARDPEVVVWWGTPVECASAIARLEREGALSTANAAESFARLDALAPSWMQIDPSDEIRESARRLLRVHALRAADALLDRPVYPGPREEHQREGRRRAREAAPRL